MRNAMHCMDLHHFNEVFYLSFIQHVHYELLHSIYNHLLGNVRTT